MPRPFTVGLTGGIGSGKTLVSDYLAEQGIWIVDADLVSRACVAPGEPALETIGEYFGQELIRTDGHLDRSALRTIVFNDPSARHWLEQLLHPLIANRIESELEQACSDYVLLVSPLLLETSQRKTVDRVLVVDAPEELQIERASRRDEASREQTRRIIAAQMSREQRLRQSDDNLLNDGSPKSLYEKVDKLHSTYLKLARQKTQAK